MVFEKIGVHMIHINYSQDGTTDTIASLCFETNVLGLRELSEIKDNKGEIKFTYIT